MEADVSDIDQRERIDPQIHATANIELVPGIRGNHKHPWLHGSKLFSR